MTTRYRLPLFAFSQYLPSGERVLADSDGWFTPENEEQEKAMKASGFIPENSGFAGEVITTDDVDGLEQRLDTIEQYIEGDKLSGVELKKNITDLQGNLSRLELETDSSLESIGSTLEKLTDLASENSSAISKFSSAIDNAVQVSGQAKTAADTAQRVATDTNSALTSTNRAVAALTTNLESYKVNIVTPAINRISNIEARLGSIPTTGAFTYRGAWPPPPPSDATRGRLALIQGVADSDLIWVDRGSRWSPLNGVALLASAVSGYYTQAQNSTVVYFREFPAGIVPANSELRIDLAVSTLDTSTTNKVFSVGISPLTSATGVGTLLSPVDFVVNSQKSADSMTVRVFNRGNRTIRVVTPGRCVQMTYDMAVAFRIFVSVNNGVSTAITGLESVTMTLYTGA